MPPAIIRLLRPGDWVKNVFVLIPLVFALQSSATADVVGDALPAIAAAMLAFVAFSVLSSGFYCLNDVFDAADDRLHPFKRHRPVAAGEVAPTTALRLGATLIVVGLALGFAVDVQLGVILALYVALQALYNLRLKQAMLVDVVTVAIGFGLRAAAGAAAIDVQISIWLLLCVFFLCLYLGFVKRLSDLTSARRHDGDAWSPPAGYDDLGELNWLLSLSAGLAIVTYLMYTLSAHAHELFGARAIGLALLTPLVIIAIHRFYRRARTGRSDSPLSALREDRGVITAVVLFVVGIALSLYVPAVEMMLDDVFYAVWVDAR